MALIPVVYLSQVDSIEVSPAMELSTITAELSAPRSFGSAPASSSQRSGTEVLAAVGVVLPTTTTTSTTSTTTTTTLTTTTTSPPTTLAPTTTSPPATAPPRPATVAEATTTAPPTTTTTTTSAPPPTTTLPPTTTTLGVDPLGILDPPSGETTSDYQNRDEGVASWFGAPEATCAHVEIPKGTVVKVTRIDTGVSTTCVINDWGPADRSRIIDLSDDTFEKLAPLSVGLIDVVIEW